MDATIKGRLDEFIRLSGLNRRRFQIECGLGNGYMTNMKDNAISSHALQRISERFPELNTEWLLNGVGDMLGERDKLTEAYETIAQLRELVRQQSVTIEALTEIVKRGGRDGEL